MNGSRLRSPADVLIGPVPLSEYLSGAKPIDCDGQDLSNLELTGRDLARARLTRTTLSGTQLSGAALAGADLTLADASGARLDGADLSGATLTSAVLDRSSLRNADLSGVVAHRASFREADLTAASLRGADLQEADLRSARLVDVDFSDLSSDAADGGSIKARLRGADFGGADLDGASMPAGHGFPLVDAVKDASAECTRIFLLLLAALVHAALTLAATLDAKLLPESSIFPLPVVQTAMPVLLFYAIAPLLLLLLFLYLQICLDRLWRRLRTVPVRLPDGTGPLDRLPLSLVSFLLSPDRRGGHAPADTLVNGLAQVISAVSVQAGAPLVLGLFWLRYVPRHDMALSSWHSLLFATSVGVMLFFGALRRDSRAERPIARLVSRAAAMTAVLFAAAAGLSASASYSALPQRLPWLAADVTRQDVSTKPANWDGKDNSTVQGARLRELNLRYIKAGFAFLAKADLEQADLRGGTLPGADLGEALLTRATLEQADLRNAVLTGARLDHATLRGADLRGADMRIADLFRAALDGADLRGANLEDAQFLDAGQLATAVTDRSTILPNGTRGPFLPGKGLEKPKEGIPIEESIHADEIDRNGS